MKKTLLATAAFMAITAFPVVSHAQDAEAASPLSFNIGAVTDYRFRGISQSRLLPAVQGGADYAFSNGFYVGTWLSTIRWINDAGRAPTPIETGNAPIEWDLYGGYKGEIQKDLSYDVGALVYYYPGNHYDRLGGGAHNANTTEIYGALTFGPATVKYSHAVTNLFGNVDSKNSGYIEAAASFDVGSGVTITPHVGYQKVRGSDDLYSYTDYSVTAAKDFAGFVVSLAVVGTDQKDNSSGDPAYTSYTAASGKDLGRLGVVLGVKKTF